MSMHKRIASFKWAFNGFKILFKEEFNGRVHLTAAIVVVCLGIFFKIRLYEWIAILLVIAMVIGAELINTAIEGLADFVSPEKTPMIKKVKDLAAAAVLMHAVIAAIVGLIIFVPRIVAYI